MIKECPILLTNDYVTVVRFGKVDVQLPPIHHSANTVYVCFSNGQYKVVDNSFDEISSDNISKRKRSRTMKKTTAINEESNDEHNEAH